MADSYFFSPSKLTFYPVSLQAAYTASGNWPDDLVAVDAETFTTYSATPPDGMTRGADAQGQPVWANLPPLSVPEQAMLLLRGPVTVQSTSKPALDGSYPIDQSTQIQISSIAAALAAGMGLPGGGATFNWPDTQGNPHSWDADSFTAFAKGIMEFLYAASQTAQGHTPTLPAATIAIP